MGQPNGDRGDRPDDPPAAGTDQQDAPQGRRRGDQRSDDAALYERITRLEAQLASDVENRDAQVRALYSGMRALVAELIRRRRQAEETCETLTRVLEATSDAFVALDSEWRYTYVNEHAGRMFGRDPESLIGKHIWTEFPDGVGQPFHLEYERAVREGKPRQIEAFYPPFGRWFENRIFPYAGGLAIFFQDVTERHVADERLRESEERYRSLFDQNPDAVYSFDADGRFVSANAACEALTGYLPEELIGTSFAPLVVPEDRERAAEHFRAALAGSARSYEETILHKHGARVPIAITKLPMVVGGQVVGIYGIAKNLSAQRDLETRLHQAQKMEAIGRLAGGVAHDFNNLLTIIQSCASFLAAAVPKRTSMYADVEEIQTAGRRAGELTQQLLAFSRAQVLRPQLMDVNQHVKAFVGMLRRVIGEDIRVETRLAADTWPVLADPGQLERVLMNLGVNARDAMPNGGTLRVRTENVTLDVVTAERLGLAAGPHVKLVVEDSGSGIDPEVLPRIFEPFVTTKDRGLGTGLGLATVYGIVDQTGGAIDVASAPGHGARFSIYFPRAESLEVEDDEDADAALPRGTETILLVEDDAAVRAIARRILQRQGYTVLEAASGADALRLLETPNGKADLLLTDVVLAGQNGREVADQVATRLPGVRVLFMSGYPDDEILRRGLLEPGMAFVAKPVTPDRLAHAVRRALDEL